MEEYFERCTRGPPFKDNEEMKYEFCRLMSFNSWPTDSPVFPLKLAKAGFYYTGHFDEVKCFKCRSVKSSWLAGDEPDTVHRQLNPDCPFLSEGMDELNIPFNSSDASEEDSSLVQRLNIILEESEVGGEDESYNVDDVGAAGGERVEDGTSEQGIDTEGSEDFQQPKFNLGTDERTSESPELAVSRSQSLGNLQQFSRRGLQNESLPESRSSTFPDTHTGRDANLPDSAVMLENIASGSTSRSALSDGKTKSKEDKKKDKSVKKSKEKKDKKSSKSSKSSSSSRRGSDASTVSQQGQDIPPPTGESIGPLRFERNRLQTFHNWPSNACVPAAELAKCGFYYTGSGDRVQCIFCKGVLRNWEEGDRPHIEHRKHFPRCPLVLGLKMGNVPLPLDENPATSTSQGSRMQNSNAAANVADSLTDMENLGIITDRPKQPLYAIESQRLASFQAWPPYKHQTPQQLAQAGFWYAGFSDNVKCFYCDGGLRNWEPGDEPWKEHARWFPKCPFVIQVRGQEFISNVLKEKGVEIPTYINTPKPGTAAASSEQSRGQYRVEEREIRARMDSPYIRKVLDLGISQTVVMNTLRKRLRETGDDFPSLTSLMEAIFKEDAEEANRQSQNPPQSQNAVSSQNASASQNISENQTVPNDVQSNNETENPDVSQSSEIEGTATKEDESKKTDEVVIDMKENEEGEKRPSAVYVQADDLMKENLELKEQRLCKICMSYDANVVFLPCGHLVSCATCAPALQLCPICRASIKGTIRTYIA